MSAGHGSQLLSQILFSTRTGSFTREEEAALRREDDALLIECANRVNAKSAELIERFRELKRAAAVQTSEMNDLKASLVAT